LNNLPRSQTEGLIKGVTGGKSIPEEVQSALVAKSDGIPLFIEEMTKMVLEGGMLELVDDKYVLAGSLPDLDIPATLQDSLMARLDRMEAGAKKVAQVGACIGREFSIELTNAVVPGEESALRRGLGRLVEAQLVFAAQGQSTESYSFKHALIQDAAYESLLKRTRHEYHGRIAETLERDFPELTETQPEQLALHYAKAGQPEKAIPYWLKAGQKAVASSANAEAVNHLKQGLALLDELPENMERIQQKITFLSTLGTALSAIQGYASDEVKRTYARARELCEEIGQTPQLFWVYWGLWAFHLVRAEHHEAVMFGDKMMSLAKQQKDLSLELEAHFSLGLSYFFMGNLKPARKHLEKAVSIYEPEKHHANAYLTIQDVGVTSRSVAALCLWHLGETDLALERSGQALTLAEELAHPYSKAYALGCASWFNLYLRDIQTAEHHAHNAVELSIEQGFIWWLIWGTILGGRAMADSGEASTSVAQMKEGIEGWRKTGSAFTIPYFLALLSEACAADGQTEDALNLVAEARTLVEKTGEGFFEAELHRLTGELLSRLEQKEAMKSIEDCYRRAYDIARVQGAKALELRASMSLGRFWHEQGKTEEAHHILSDTLSWFEGRAKTRDVLDARELLQSFQVKQGTRPQRHAPRRKQSAVSSQPE
jgi:predicted ATPase